MPLLMVSPEHAREALRLTRELEATGIKAGLSSYSFNEHYLHLRRHGIDPEQVVTLDEQGICWGGAAVLQYLANTQCPSTFIVEVSPGHSVPIHTPYRERARELPGYIDTKTLRRMIKSWYPHVRDVRTIGLLIRQLSTWDAGLVTDPLQRGRKIAVKQRLGLDPGLIKELADENRLGQRARLDRLAAAANSAAMLATIPDELSARTGREHTNGVLSPGNMVWLIYCSAEVPAWIMAAMQGLPASTSTNLPTAPLLDVLDRMREAIWTGGVARPAQVHGAYGLWVPRMAEAYREARDLRRELSTPEGTAAVAASFSHTSP